MNRGDDPNGYGNEWMDNFHDRGINYSVILLKYQISGLSQFPLTTSSDVLDSNTWKLDAGKLLWVQCKQTFKTFVSVCFAVWSSYMYYFSLLSEVHLTQFQCLQISEITFWSLELKFKTDVEIWLLVLCKNCIGL